MSYENLCMNCMKDIGNETQCPYCRFHNDSPQLPPFLPHKTVIGGRYLIGNVTEANGDGVSYMAYDLEKKSAVVVREFLPDTLITRSGESSAIVVKPGKETQYATCLNDFLDLFRKLARMRGLTALILVIDILEENNTAYAVSEYIEGSATLRDYLLTGKTGYMSWEEARIMFMPVLSTLSTLHSAGIIHRGISPNTLLVSPDRKIRISGFSIPACRNVGSGIASEIFAGYAPVEQYGLQAPSGPWTDIYAFAAVLYRALIGSTPIESTVRMNSDRMMIPAKFAEQIPAYVINALINALQIMPEDRTKTVEQFRSELTASPTDALAADYEPPRPAPVARQHQTPRNRPQPEHAKPAKKNASSSTEQNNGLHTALIAGGIATAVLIIIFIILCFTVLKDHIGVPKDEGTTKPTSASAEPVEVPKFEGRTYTSISSQKSYSTNFDLEVTEEFNTEVKKGYVISQSVEPGQKVPKGSKVSIVVSKGIEQITMIDVVGKTYEEASASLTELGFVCKRIDKINISNNTSGTVAASDLKPDTEYDKGSTVTLQVWTEATTDADVPQ